MASVSNVKRSSSNCRSGLLSTSDSRNAVDICSNNDNCIAETSKSETSLCKDLEGLDMSKSLERVDSDRFIKKKRNDSGTCSGEGRTNAGPISFGCLSFYLKGGGCRVGACDEPDVNVKRRLGALDDCMPHRTVNDVRETGEECFSSGVSEKFWRKSLRKGKDVEQLPTSSSAQVSLPDDVLEMIFARLPLITLMTARCVCKKWRHLTTTPHFKQMRSEGPFHSPWLFLFGVTRYGCRASEIHALDVSMEKWHRISNNNLKGRFLFSVAAVGTDAYIVGGRSSSSFSTDKISIKSHKGILVFSPLTGSWHKAASMRSARSRPVVGVFKIGKICSIYHAQPDQQDRPSPIPRSRVGGVSEVYEDPHRHSVRRRLRLRDAFFEEDDSPEPMREHDRLAKSDLGKTSRFALIVVGGRGCWDEPLDSGEIYDPATGRWMGIANLPGDFGSVCSGAVCGQMFYVYSEADKLASYDLQRGFWVTVQTSRPPPRLQEYYPKLVSCRNRLFLLSVSWCERDGLLNRREKAVRKLWELDFAMPAWNEVSRHPDAPMDWNAAFISDDNRIYGFEMFKIFGQVLDFLTVCHVSDTEIKWTRGARKHAGHEAAASCTTKSLVALHL